ncbi:hypothetical protein [Catenulispora subtropica]|uniref:Uncharacterized protein n=1 Tax=Catenulispora subtropica TaxID=450798 RepID=A0ABN2QFN9_9ACTN
MDEHGYGYGEPDDDRDWSPRSRGGQPGSRSHGAQSDAGRRVGRAAPEPPRRRTGLIVGAVVAAAAVGVGAAYAGGVFKKDDASPTASSSPTTSATGGTAAAPSQSSTAAADAPSSAAGSSSDAAGAAAVVAPTAGAKNAGVFYNFADVSLMPNANPPDPATIGSVFASKSVQARYWNSTTNKAQAAAMCGAKQPTLAVIAAATGGATVSFYEKGLLAAQQAHVAVDKSTQKITSITCAKSVAPTFVATRKVVGYYGAPPGKGVFPTSSKTYAPKSADGPGGPFDIDAHECAQYGPESWVFYAPVSTTSGDAWRFAYDGDTNPNVEVLFTDPATGDFERTLCGGFPDIPAPDKAAAGKDNDPASLLVSRIFSAYVYERSQQSAGAVPVDEMAPYFVSVDVYQAAQKNTGKIPFLCATKAPTYVAVNGTPSISGDTETLSLTASYSDSPAPDDSKATPVGKFTVAVDLSTMKIKALTCA